MLKMRSTEMAVCRGKLPYNQTLFFLIFEQKKKLRRKNPKRIYHYQQIDPSKRGIRILELLLLHAWKTRIMENQAKPPGIIVGIAVAIDETTPFSPAPLELLRGHNPAISQCV
jgi:hypothetical protein